MSKDNIARQVFERIRDGLGAEIHLAVKTRATGKSNAASKTQRVVIIPSPVYSTSGNSELLIACEGRGVHFYNGLFPLNEFKLISSGFPIELAQIVAKLVNEIMWEACNTRPQETLRSEHIDKPVLALEGAHK